MEKLEHSPLHRLLGFVPLACKAGLLSLVLSPCVHTFLLLALSWGNEKLPMSHRGPFSSRPWLTQLLPQRPGYIPSTHPTVGGRGQCHWGEKGHMNLLTYPTAILNRASFAYRKAHCEYLFCPSSAERQAGFPTLWDIWAGRKGISLFPTKSSARWGLMSYKWVNKWRLYLILINADTVNMSLSRGHLLLKPRRQSGCLLNFSILI